MKTLRVTKIAKETMSGGVWGELESREGFQKQSFTKYVRLNLAFIWNNALHEKFNIY